LTEQPIPRVSKEQLRAAQFRSRAAELLKDPYWLDEGVRYWLEKELRRPPDYIYTENEHAALARIIAASTMFESWDGYTVPELLDNARGYKANGSYEDEVQLDELKARNPTQLRLREMAHLVGFCRNIAGLQLARFKPEIKNYDGIA
jgi:hypothetical protein